MNRSKQYDATLPLSVEDSLNTDKLQMDLTAGPYLEYPDGTVPMVTKMNTGRMSPVRSRTMKEYDSQITDLKKENFNLKLRIYFMEERMQQRLGDGDDVFKINIELKVEIETLKKELKEKQELLKKASEAIEALAAKREEDLQEIREELEQEMSNTRARLEEEVECKKKEVEASQKSLQEATHQLTDLENRNEQLVMEIRHLEQSKEIQLQSLKEDLDAQKRELTAQIAENQQNLGEMDHLLKMKEDLEERVESLEKELSRKDRDMEHLSCIVKDTTQVESQSFLAPRHLQDEVDDQKSELSTLKSKVEDLKEDANKKNEMIGKLEDLLKANEEEKKDALKKLKESENKLQKRNDLQPLWDSTVKGLHQDLRKRNKEVDDLKDKLERKEEELRQCQDDLHSMSVKKQKEVDKQHEDIVFLEDSLSSMKVQLKERELQVENLLKNLGKKEGELEGFKELLNKAETALRQSEDAVQDLQCQLKKEKEIASEDYKSQHLQFKVDDLEAQLQTKDKIIQQLTEGLKDKERQMQQCMEIFRPTPQEDGSVKDKWIRELQSRLQEKENAVEESLNEKMKLADEKDAEIRQLKREIRDKEHEMDRANQMLLTAEQTIECLEKEGDEKDKTLKQLTNALKAAQQSLEDAVAEHKQEMQKKKDEIERLKKEITVPDVESKGSENADTMNSLLRKLRDKDEDLLKQAEKHDNEINKLDKEIHNLKAELAKVQRELQAVENRCGWSEKRNQDTLDDLRETIKEKDKMIQALVASGQDKERLIGDLQGVNTPVDVVSLQNQLEKLKNELQDKNDLLDSWRFSENDQVTSEQMDNLKSELEAAKDDLRKAFRREEIIQQELYDHRQKFPTQGGERHKVEIEVRNVCEHHSEGSPGQTGQGQTEDEGQKLKSALEKQLSELEKLSEAIKRERQIIQDLNEIEPKINGAFDNDLKTELKKVQDLRKELETVLDKNNKMTTNLQQQYIIYKRKFSDDYTTGMVSELTSDLDGLKRELEQKKHENNTLLAQLYDIQYNHRDHDMLHEGVQTSPRSENRWSMSSSTSSSSSPEFDVPLNRQTLSDMSAPMLRRYIRQIQKQLDISSHEKEELQERLNLSQRVNAREIPGKNEDDFNSVPHLRMEVQSLQSKLSAAESDLKVLRKKFGLEENSPCRYSELPNMFDLQRENVKLKNDYQNALEKVSCLQEQINNSLRTQREKLDKHSQTVAWSGLIPALGPKSLDLKCQNKKNSSQIPRPQKPGHPLNGDQLHLQKPEILREMLCESKNRISDLEAKLEATEGTVRIQTQKMKHYKAILQEHGLLAKSPCVSRSHSETNLAAAMATASKIPVRKRAMSIEHLHSIDINQPNGQSRHGSDSSEGSQEDTLLPSQTLVNLQERISVLQQDLQETKDNNSKLQQKISAQQNSEQVIAELKTQLGQSREAIDSLEKQLKSYQGSSMQEVLELQRDEIAGLRRRLCDSQNSCVQLNQWLGDLSGVLEGLRDGEGQYASIKQKVQQTRKVAKSLSHILDSDSDDSGNEGCPPQSNHSPVKSPKKEAKRLAEELESKEAEIKSLKEELEEKKSFIGRLNTNLLIAQRQLLTWQDCGKGSSTSGTSAADGNVFESGRQGPREGFLRDSLSPSSQTSNRLTGEQDTSIEKVRHGSGMTQSSRRSSDDIEVQDTTVTSTHTQGSVHSRKDRIRDMDKVDLGRKDNVPYGMFGFCSDERLYGNARFADRDMFEQSLSMNGHGEMSFLENKDFYEDVSKFSELDDTRVTQRSSFMNRSAAVQTEEVHQLKSRLNVMEDLNKTLKDELEAYENLCSSVGIKSSPRKSPRKSTDDSDLLREHLSEIRALRIKLEKSLKDSEKLSQKLQQDMEESHTSNNTTNVYMYTQHQAHINELQRAIDKLKAQLREKENCITEKITIIREKERIIHESKTVITGKDEKINEILKEKEELKLSNQQTLVVQQRRIEKQDETMRQLRDKLELQVESLHQQESKLKEQYEVIQKQELQLAQVQDKLSVKESTLEKQYELLHQQDLQIDKQRELINQKDQTYRSLEEELESTTAKLQQLQRVATTATDEESAEQWRKEAQGLREQVERLEKTVSSQNKKMKQQEQWLTEKDKTNYKLQQIRDRLDDNLKKSAKEIKRLKEEMRTLRDQVQENKDLNKTLKLELSVYEKLENTENQGWSNGDGKSGGFDMREFLTEIRHLRSQLERCIDTNNELRKKLEEHLVAKNQRQRVSMTNVYYAKDPSPVTSQGTDAPDGLPSTEQMSGGFKVRHESVEIMRGTADHDSMNSVSQDSCISDCASGTSSNFGKPGFGISTWPLTADNPLQAMKSKSSPGGTLDRVDLSVMSTKLHHSDGNLSYHVDDPPSLVAEMTSHRVDSDLRTLFAIGKLDDYEKLKKECGETSVVLKGMEARIQERLKIFRNMSPRENMEYSTLKELSLSVENLRICLNEEKSLLSCFWTSSLPKEGVESKLLFENESLKNELLAIKSKYSFLSQFVQSAEERLHATNQQKQNMEDFIYRQLKKTTKVMVHARGNFEKNLLQYGMTEKQEDSRRKRGYSGDPPVCKDK